MGKLGLATVLLLTIVLQKCSSPEQIQSQFQSNLRPYFRDARVEMVPEQQTILAFTCVYGAGLDTVKYTGSELRQKTSDAIQRSVIRSWGYRYVVVAFDIYAIVIDLKTEQMLYESRDGNEPWATAYRNECGR